MNLYPSRVVLGLLVPMVALAGCSSSSSSAKSPAASAPSKTATTNTPAKTTASTPATPDAQAKLEATKKQLLQNVAQDSNGVHLLWSHAGTGAAKYLVPKGAQVVRVSCTGGGGLTYFAPGNKKPEQLDCSVPTGMTVVFDASNTVRSLEILKARPQTVWAVGAWKDLRHH